LHKAQNESKMLTAITLQNFKGIGAELMRVPIKPLTILFGANSIGKSTIVQAIHYAREILERNNLDPDRTIAGGSAVDLGGFKSLVHNHDINNKIVLRFDLDLSETDLPSYRHPRARETQPDDVSSLVKSAWVELTVEWSAVKERPVLSVYETGINNISITKTVTSSDEANIVVEYNSLHPLFRLAATSDHYGEPLVDPPEAHFESDGEVRWYSLDFYDGPTTSVPLWGKSLLVDDDDTPEEYTFEEFSGAITQVLVGTGELLRDLLRRFRYLGPLRRTLPRSHRRTLTPDESLWADGTAAWDVLASASQDFVSGVNAWLADAKRLNTGFSVRLNKFRRIPADSPLLTELFLALKTKTFFENYSLSDFEKERDRHEIEAQLVIVDESRNLEVQPYDIGVGISRVIPVVVAALDTQQGIVAVEQPELHLHPAVQAELGDLFIESALGVRDNVTLIETHSEHLILRVLRRIRESSANKNESTPPVTPDDLSLLFVGNRQTGTNIQPLRVDKRGRIIDRIPGGFFEEDFEELF
jgi:hypothetical protein